MIGSSRFVRCADQPNTGLVNQRCDSPDHCRERWQRRDEQHIGVPEASSLLVAVVVPEPPPRDASDDGHVAVEDPDEASSAGEDTHRTTEREGQIGQSAMAAADSEPMDCSHDRPDDGCRQQAGAPFAPAKKGVQEVHPTNDGRDERYRQREIEVSFP